ncbi:ring-cleavage extradiol dioxygenase [Ketogulonicigenium robustum]|uniref:Ring-cleavage extradiol dioxygenase n=1 Tax=Ketogulonicigenium robustum TaxID=92947 RepID=A0A1W6NYC6_9RHOB|nr:VOC family protein [Ketogulonicigenium robustum]ARO14027.1 ring-cleavage extradiol dioxygenase [Ketogulonicigenium robustum]
MTISNQAPTFVGGVTLTVKDLPTVADYYRTLLNLETHSSDGAEVVLGADTPFLTLRGDKSAQNAGPRQSGLFHTAFLLPQRADLGRWVMHAIDKRIAVGGASDHGVSEAIYLTDPEGNGIEIYTDRAHADWPSQSDGSLDMYTEALNVQDLVQSAGNSRWAGIPQGSYIGHVHLQTAILSAAENFYAKALGFEVTTRYPGAIFYGSGGYHHHLASNIWNSRNSAPRTAHMTGLSEVRLLNQTPAVQAQMVAGLQAAGAEFAETDGAIRISDPSNTLFDIRVKEA